MQRDFRQDKGDLRIEKAAPMTGKKYRV